MANSASVLQAPGEHIRFGEQRQIEALGLPDLEPGEVLDRCFQQRDRVVGVPRLQVAGAQEPRGERAVHGIRRDLHGAPACRHPGLPVAQPREHHAVAPRHRAAELRVSHLFRHRVGALERDEATLELADVRVADRHDPVSEAQPEPLVSPFQQGDRLAAVLDARARPPFPVVGVGEDIVSLAASGGVAALLRVRQRDPGHFHRVRLVSEDPVRPPQPEVVRARHAGVAEALDALALLEQAVEHLPEPSQEREGMDAVEDELQPQSLAREAVGHGRLVEAAHHDVDLARMQGGQQLRRQTFDDLDPEVGASVGRV